MKGATQSIRFQLQGAFIALTTCSRSRDSPQRRRRQGAGRIGRGAASMAAVETRKTCKIRAGQQVDVAATRIVVSAPGPVAPTDAGDVL